LIAVANELEIKLRHVLLEQSNKIKLIMSRKSCNRNFSS